MLGANKASASSALTTLIQNARITTQWHVKTNKTTNAQYNQGFQQLQALADMGIEQNSLEYQKRQDAVNRDLQFNQYCTEH